MKLQVYIKEVINVYLELVLFLFFESSLQILLSGLLLIAQLINFIVDVSCIFGCFI